MACSAMWAPTVAVVCLIVVNPLQTQARSQEFQEHLMKICENIAINQTAPFKENDAMASPEVCDIVTEFIRCTVEATAYPPTREYVEMDNDGLIDAVGKLEWLQGISCNFNLTAILGLHEKSTTTTQSSTAGEAESVNTTERPQLIPILTDISDRQCRGHYNKLASSDNVTHICPLIKLLLTCDLSKRPTRKFGIEESRAYEDMVVKEQKRAGTSCQIDVRAAMDEHNEQVNSGNSIFGSGFWLQQGILASLGVALVLQYLA